MEKADLDKGYQNPKRKLRVTMHFSEKFELKLGKKLSYLFLYSNAFLELWLLNKYLWKIRGYPHFSFWIPLNLAKVYFSPTVITFAKILLYQEAPSLIASSLIGWKHLSHWFPRSLSPPLSRTWVTEHYLSDHRSRMVSSDLVWTLL